MNWLSEPVRLFLLITLCTLLWSLESIIPLYKYKNSRLRHALPNVALTVGLLLTNLALAFASALAAEFAIKNGVGLFPLVGLSPVLTLILGVAGLDLFTYFPNQANRENRRSGFQEHKGSEWNATVAVVSGNEIHGGVARFSVRLVSRNQELVRGFPSRRKARETNCPPNDQNGHGNKQDAWRGKAGCELLYLSSRSTLAAGCAGSAFARGTPPDRSNTDIRVNFSFR